MTQLATPFPEPQIKKFEIRTDLLETTARAILMTVDGDEPIVSLYIPNTLQGRTKAETLEAIASLRLLLAATEAALRASDPAETWDADMFPLVGNLPESGD